MKAPHKMQNEQLIKWAIKTANTIGKYPPQRRLCTATAERLVDRQRALYDEIQHRELWAYYCELTGSCTEHDVYDLFA